MKKNGIKKKIFYIIQIGDKSNIISRIFDFFIVAVILSNILVMYLQTFEQLQEYMNIFKAVEIGTTLVFCVEYVLRIWTADYLYPEYGKIKSRLKFLISYDGVVDLLTIIPVFFLTGFIAFRMLRVVRILHLFRINAKNDSFNVITSVLLKKSNQIISSIFIIFILMLASSLCMYSAEHNVQPEVFKNAFSGIWWSVSTVLTVGYGDIYPITVLGKCMAIIIAFMGVLLVAIPTGIISAGFVEQYRKEQSEGMHILDIKKIGELLITKDHAFIGKKIVDVMEQHNVTVYLLMRDGMSIVPTTELEVKEGDILIIQSNTIIKKISSS